jgi:predicted RNA-binding protein YlxR (DUF448 family)
MERVPIRTCVGCRRRRSQGELLRIARRPGGTVSVDVATGGRSPGRGAYVCADPACARRAVASGQLRRALGVALPPDVTAKLSKGIAERAANPQDEERRYG